MALKPRAAYFPTPADQKQSGRTLGYNAWDRHIQSVRVDDGRTNGYVGVKEVMT